MFQTNREILKKINNKYKHELKGVFYIIWVKVCISGQYRNAESSSIQNLEFKVLQFYLKKQILYKLEKYIVQFYNILLKIWSKECQLKMR